MAAPRKSTVYDLAGLRLHVDGRRVNQVAPNLGPTKAKTTMRDSRGNWIAKDAGGSATVSRYTKVKAASAEPAEPNEEKEPEASEGLSSSEGEDDGASARSRKKRKGKGRMDERTKKRKKFAEDFDFLESLSRPREGGASPESGDELPEPSGEFLKIIHHFAASHYSERGQLINASRESRRQRKERAAKKKGRRGTSEPLPRNEETHGDGVSEDEEILSDRSTATPSLLESGSPEANGRPGRARRANRHRDMYKVFDGSGLMAIGILLQEYIRELLSHQVPPEWEESVQESDSDEGEDATRDVQDPERSEGTTMSPASRVTNTGSGSAPNLTNPSATIRTAGRQDASETSDSRSDSDEGDDADEEDSDNEVSEEGGT